MKDDISATSSAPIALDEKSMDRVGQMLEAEFKENAQKRRPDEERWLEDMLQVQGRYSPEVENRIDPGCSKAFIRLTSSKVKQMTARILDAMFPASGQLNWGIKPSPKPELEPDMMQSLRVQVVAQNDGEYSEEMFRAAVLKVAEARAENMKQLIADQLAETPSRPGQRQIARRVITSGLVYGTGIQKGPLVTTAPRWGWQLTQDGMWEYVEGQEVLHPFIDVVSIWSFFPEMESWQINDCLYTHERHVMNSNDLAALAGRKDFRSETIMKFMKENPDGRYEQMWFEQDLRKAKKQPDIGQLKYRYEVRERWGWLRGKDLMDCGVELPHEDGATRDYASLVWTLGDKVIKSVLSPVRGMILPYQLWYFEKPENSIFGVGVPEASRDPQSSFNSAVRAMLDNAAFAAGPMGGVNVTALDDTEEADKIKFHPKKLFKFADAEDMAKALMFFPMPIRTTELMQVAETMKSYMDETTVPAYMGGQTQVSGAAKTMGGLSMLMGSLNIVMADLVKSYDDSVTKPQIEGYYNWNMQFSEDPEVKGDYEVEALGTSMLIAREMLAQQVMQIMQVTDSPRFLPHVKDSEMLEALFRYVGTGDQFLRTEQERETYERKQLAAQFEAQVEAVLVSMEKRGIDPQAALGEMLQQAMLQAQAAQGQPQQ